MVGEEVQLEASPAAALSSVQWSFDSTSTDDVVSSFGLAGSPTASPAASPAVLGTPGWVATSTNPTKFYWVNGDTLQWVQSGEPADHYVNLVAYAPNVQGPLVADVYYPVAAPVPSVGASAVPMQHSSVIAKSD
jgi:hypothetical protein